MVSANGMRTATMMTMTQESMTNQDELEHKYPTNILSSLEAIRHMRTHEHAGKGEGRKGTWQNTGAAIAGLQTAPGSHKKSHEVTDREAASGVTATFALEDTS
eukprot:2849550-Karenia_brevis.AAC.1